MLKSQRKENSSRETRYITRNTADLVCSQRIGKQEKTHFERFLRRKWLRQRSTKYNTRPLPNHTYVTNLRQHKWHREKTEHTSDVPHSNAFFSLMHPTVVTDSNCLPTSLPLRRRYKVQNRSKRAFHTYLSQGRPWSRRRLPQEEASTLHSVEAEACDSPNVGNSGAQFLLAGVRVRAAPHPTKVLKKDVVCG